jgi:hypothetical protein
MSPRSALFFCPRAELPSSTCDSWSCGPTQKYIPRRIPLYPTLPTERDPK